MMLQSGLSSDQTIEEEMGLAAAVAEDAEAECIRRITETQIVTGLHHILFGHTLHKQQKLFQNAGVQCMVNILNLVISI